MDFSEFYKGVEILKERDKYTKCLRDEARVGKNFNIDPAVLKRVSSYIFNYQSDWDGNDPFTPLVGADSHCKIASATRKLLQIIKDLKEVNRLDLLEPITAALRSEGIYLEVDESENDIRPEINQALDNMVQVREYVKNLADEKKKLAEETAANAICTEKCFNSTVMAMKKVDKNPDKLDESIQQVGIKATLNSRDNMVYNSYIEENGYSLDNTD